MGVLAFPHLIRTSRCAVALVALAVSGLAGAQTASSPTLAGKATERTVNEWLVRMHEASRTRNYVGTFVVSSNVGAMSSARIWHACDAEQQLERVETLTGAPRSTFRRNDEVLVFHPESRVVKVEKRESAGMFPDLLQSRETSIPEFYAARRIGQDRVAGHDADVVLLAPKDNLRFGYRIWSEKKSGLVVKLQTLDTEGNVLEQSAFSELQLDAPVRPEKLLQMMMTPEGWRVEKAEAVKANALAEGWVLKSAIPGFRSTSCYRRPGRPGSASEGTMQWIFSDGLASVSLFVESYDRQKHVQEGHFAAGATHSFTRRIQDWWLTVVGEAPAVTLRAFAQNLERRK